jgi:hypothetical protein
MSISISLSGYIQATDSVSGTVALQKALSSLSNTGLTAFSEVQQGTFGSSPTSISLPVSPAQFVYIKNTHGTQTLTVTWTPNGGSSNPVVTLEPGSAIILCEVAAGAGITALSLTGSSSNTTAEYIIGG